MKKEEFKQFVKNNPKLIKFVNNNEMTWQKFYEMYDLYGEEESIWKDYIGESNNEVNQKNVSTPKPAGIGSLSLSEVVNWFKNVDLDGIQEGIGNVQRVLGVVQDFSKKDNTTTETKPTYKPRPLYKHFED